MLLICQTSTHIVSIICFSCAISILYLSLKHFTFAAFSLNIACFLLKWLNFYRFLIWWRRYSVFSIVWTLITLDLTRHAKIDVRDTVPFITHVKGLILPIRGGGLVIIIKTRLVRTPLLQQYMRAHEHICQLVASELLGPSETGHHLILIPGQLRLEWFIPVQWSYLSGRYVLELIRLHSFNWFSANII